MREAINELRRSSGPDEGGLRHALRDDIRDDISMQSEGREWSSICTLASSWRNSEELDVTAPARISECPPMSVCTHIHIHGHNAGALEPRGDPCAGLIVHVGAQAACKFGGHQVIMLSSSCHQVWLSSSHQIVIKSSNCHQVIKLSSSLVVISLGGGSWLHVATEALYIWWQSGWPRRRRRSRGSADETASQTSSRT